MRSGYAFNGLHQFRFDGGIVISRADIHIQRRKTGIGVEVKGDGKTPELLVKVIKHLFHLRNPRESQLLDEIGHRLVVGH